MNKRRHRRKRVHVAVTLDPGGMKSFTVDVSAQGVFVRSARVLLPGTPVRLAIEGPSGQACGEGVVRWAKRVPSALLAHTKGGMGIQIVTSSAELAHYLEQLFGEDPPEADF